MKQPALILFYVFMNFETLTLASSSTSSVFKLAYGYKITQGTPLGNWTSTAMKPIFCALLCSSECNSATFSVKYQTCITFKEKFFAPNIFWTADLDWCMLYRDESILQFEDLWEKYGHHDDEPLSSDLAMGCYRWDKTETCTRHFRSSVLDKWTNIEKVKFALYTNASEVAYIIFNGTSTNRQSWYDRMLILESSWSLLKTDTQAVNFNFQGLTVDNNFRRMIIFGPYASCNYDRMYVCTFDINYESCSTNWMSIPSYPLFIYSPQNQMVKVSTKPPEYAVAEIMSVFVQQKQP